MAQPVVHFEIIGTDPSALGYYGQVFGWDFETSGIISEAISRRGDYGFVERSTTDEGAGIPGGVGGGPDFEAHALFYIGVPDVEAALQRAESLGGRRRLGPATSPGGLVVGQFEDPEGNLIGVAGVS